MSAAESVHPVLAGPVPPEKPLSVLETLRVLPRNQFAIFPKAAYEQPIYEMRGAFGHVFLIHDPEGIRHVLLDNVSNYPKAENERRALGALLGDGILISEGETWRAHRRAMAPAFDPRSIQSYVPVMADAAQRFLQGWDRRAPGEVVDVAAEMTDVTLAIIARAIFSTDSDGVAAVIEATFRRALQLLNFNMADALPVIRHLRFRARERALRANSAEFDAWIYRFIDERAKNPGEGPKDLLGRLVAARDEQTGVGLTPKELRDEVVTIFIAGHETTAVAMTWVWYLLSQHPEQEARLHAELDRVLGGRAPTFADIPNLPYTRMVIEESMRLYPPAPGISIRAPLEDDVVCGVKVPRTAGVAILPWVLHRHRALWDDPDRFDPERFSPERSAARPRFAYLPFGGGPRICIGMQLAMTESVVLLATIAQRYSLRLAPGHVVDLQPRVTLKARHGMNMVLRPRAAGRAAA
ncbi:MAG: cytochrome P450 [Caulobacteraceae bacterium]|nr:cytochrome P450 [Caulobacteraceae bacterium]